MFDNVFVGVDGRSGGREAIALAKQLVQPGGQLTLAHVYRTHRVLGRAAALLLPAEREASLELLGREREAASVQAKLIIDAASSVGLGLRQLAARHRVDLLVVGSCHRGAPGRLSLGDDTRATLNGAPCPVAIAPSGYQLHELTDIGIGYDASPESHEALGAARELAARHGSTIRALSVVSLQSIPYGEPIPVGWPKFANGLVDDELKHSAQNEGVIGDATPGQPTKELAEFANEVDLLIVGSRGYGPLGRLLNGSTSHYLVRHACCPLLVLPRGPAMGGQAQPPANRTDAANS
jgi:nucleotide-binding universal stress UspA family protein